MNRTSLPFNKLFVVGAFDTVSETSQIQFCSVGEWDGLSFDKVCTMLGLIGDRDGEKKINIIRMYSEDKSEP